MIDGWICLDKVRGVSSNFAMSKVRRILGERTGYIGTLDPFATGVLPIAVGRARRFIQFTNEKEKQYEFTVLFGTATDTYDNTGKILDQTDVIPDRDQILEIIPEFLGQIDQMPPRFSAIKINGIRACDLARRNQSVELNSRKVHIFDLKLLEFSGNQAKFFVSCSKGTYIRSLAVDMANKLGSLCCVTELRRLKAGFFSLENAITLETLTKMVDTNMPGSYLIPMESPLDDIPALFLGKDDVSRLQNGLIVQSVDSEKLLPGGLKSNVKIFDRDTERFCGVCYADGYLKPIRMFLNL